MCSSLAASFLAIALVSFRVKDLASPALLHSLAGVCGLDIDCGRPAGFLGIAFVGGFVVPFSGGAGGGS